MIVVVDDPHPVNLGAEMGRPPAEEHDAVRASRDGRHGHAAHLAGLGRQGRKAGLRAQAGLLLGHEEISGKSARDIEIVSLSESVAAQPLHLVVEKRVDVEPEKIEIAGEFPADVDIAEPSQIVEHEPVRIGGAQYFHLIRLEARRSEGQEAMVVENVSGTGESRRLIEGQNDLIEIVVSRRPEIAPPCAVELRDGPVARLEKVLEFNSRRGRIGT